METHEETDHIRTSVEHLDSLDPIAEVLVTLRYESHEEQRQMSDFNRLAKSGIRITVSPVCGPRPVLNSEGVFAGEWSSAPAAGTITLLGPARVICDMVRADSHRIYTIFETGFETT